MQSEDKSLTYEQQRELERKANQERYEKLTALVSAIRIEGWKWEACTNEEVRYSNFGLGELVNESLQGRIHFGTIWNDKTKLHISTSFPRDKQNHSHVGYGETHPSINVSVSKSAEQIGKDITRRLLPEYLPMLEKVRERIRNTETYLDNKAAMGAALKAAFPQLKLRDEVNGSNYNGMKHNGSKVSLSAECLEIECSETRVELKISGLTLEQSKTLLAQFFAMKKEN